MGSEGLCVPCEGIGGIETKFAVFLLVSVFYVLVLLLVGHLVTFDTFVCWDPFNLNG